MRYHLPHVKFGKVGAVRYVALVAGALLCCAATIDDQQFNGRWDLSVNSPGMRGWWLEVSGAGTPTLKGKFVGAPLPQLEEISKLAISDGELRFALESRYRRDHAAEKGLFWARLEDGKLKGTFEIEGDPSSYLEWNGVRAPQLPEKDDGTWKKGDPVVLFDGRDLTGWQAMAPGKLTSWSVREGTLANAIGATNLVSEKKFFNFTLDAEFRVGPRANSGIALRGRYKVQLADDSDRPPSNRVTGAILNRIAPTSNAARPADEWQTLAVRLVGRQVTVVINGVRVIDKQTIDGPTSVALDSNESDPGPVILQGDRGAVEFRRIVAYPLTKPK
jgi:3-keto-disaccharide hydrolase